MNPATQQMLAGLLEAIKAENDGYYFYLMSADSTRDPKGRDIFKALAEEELRHANYLKHQYKSILKDGKVDNNASLGERTDLADPSPIFSDSLLERIDGAHYEMTSLSVGVQLEYQAIQFYKEQAEKAPDPDVAAFFIQLADWESGHYNALLRQQESLKEAYWAQNSFFPF
jgi:rubrerythrin